MPRADGFEVLRRMRDNGDRTPVIVLTARQDREDTRTGFELGADDFVHKPFGIEELTLRVRAVLRRALPTTDGDNGVVTVGAVTLDHDRHRVTRAGAEVALSATEFRLLAVLMENIDRVLPKDVLLARVWGLEGDLETTVVETYVSYLRRKLDSDLSIRTVRGVGYQLLRPDSQ